jgi:hypothetical protein
LGVLSVGLWQAADRASHGRANLADNETLSAIAAGDDEAISVALVGSFETIACAGHWASFRLCWLLGDGLAQLRGHGLTFEGTKIAANERIELGGDLFGGLGFHLSALSGLPTRLDCLSVFTIAHCATVASEFLRFFKNNYRHEKALAG